MRLLLLSTSHRVAPGLLSWPAWEALRAADEVLAREPDEQLVAALGAADVTPVVLGAVPVGELARRLVEAATTGTAVHLGGADGDPGLAEALASELGRRADRGAPVPDVELVAGSWDVPGSRLLDLVAVMDRLRSPGGCPWDARQTHASLVQYLVEESYETVEAIETGDDEALREELGDLLLQVVFHARLAEERPGAPWSVDDVADGIVSKLVRRHPHVFGDADASGKTADQVEADWEAGKLVEKGRSSVLDGVPAALPALALAGKLLGRATRAGLEVPLARTVEDLPEDEDGLGDLLLGLVAAAASTGLDPERALRSSVRRYAAAVRLLEQEGGRGPDDG